MGVQHQSLPRPSVKARPPGRPQPPPAPRGRPGGLVLLPAVLLLALVHPLSWPGRPAPLWFPSAGLGLALVAWFGPKAAALVAAGALLAAARTLWLGPTTGGHWLTLFGE